MSGAKTVLILALIGLISGGILAVVFGIEDPLIRQNKRRATAAAVKAVIPGATVVEQNKQKTFIGRDAKGNLRGYAFTSEFSGFQGKIKIMVGVDRQFEALTGLEVLENLETPGLGNKIVLKEWRDGFSGLDTSQEIKLIKNAAADKGRNEVEAITGATVSSRAVIEGASAEIAAKRKEFFGR